MSRSDVWFPLYVGDYLADTMRLTTIQHGAYLLLLMEYWKSGPLPDDDDQLAATAKLDRKTWDRIAPGVRRFFSLEADGFLHQKRADFEREKAARKSEVRRDAANVRHHGGGGNDMQTDMQKDAIAPQRARSRPRERARLQPQPEKDSEPSGSDAADTASAPASARDLVWREGVPILAALTGKSSSQCRTVLGRLLRDLRDDCPRVLLVLQQCQQAHPVDPLAWLSAAAKPRDGPINGAERRIADRRDAMHRLVYGDEPETTIDHEPTERRRLQ